MAETIVSIIQVAEGADHAAVAASWDGKTSLVVSEAIKNVVKGTNAGSASALVTL